MIWDAARKDLEKLRFWAAKHAWKTGASTPEAHKEAQIENLRETLKKWNDHFFMSREEHLLCLLLDAYDHGVGDWLEKPILAKDCDELRGLLAKYFFVVQASNHKVPSVLKFIFRKLEWPHGLLTFELGDNFNIEVTEGDSGINEWIVTMPVIEDGAFYNASIIRYDELKMLFENRNIRETPKNVGPTGMLDDIPENSDRIWGSKYATACTFVTAELAKACQYDIPASSRDAIAREGAWVLANLAWFLEAASKKKHRYHYYFYRALPKPASGDRENEAIFHTSGQGLLGWASPIDTDSNHAGRQAVALTACLIFSRISDAALPYYERRAVFWGAQRVLVQRSQLMWVIDHLLLPVMIGATISRKASAHSDISPLVYSINGDDILLPNPPPDLEAFAATLWPIDIYKKGCADKKQQLTLLCELVSPLRPDSRPQSAIDSLHGMIHDLRKLPNDNSREGLERSGRILVNAQNQLASGGALFVPALVEFQKVKMAFESFKPTPAGSATVRQKRTTLGAAIDAFVNVTESVGRPASLTRVADDWAALSIKVVFCGHKSAKGPFPTRPLPFHLSELDLAVRALHDNWNRRKQAGDPIPLLSISATEEHIFVVWSVKPCWCDSEEDWRKVVAESLKRPYASARGIPYVLRFAAQNAASAIWVRTKAGSFDIIGSFGQNGSQATLCSRCAPAEPLEGAYEMGMAFPFTETKGP